MKYRYEGTSDFEGMIVESDTPREEWGFGTKIDVVNEKFSLEYEHKEKHMKTINDEITTQQQQSALKDYKEHCDSSEHIDCKPSPFWKFYDLWCSEKGLYNDRASFQRDDQEE